MQSLLDNKRILHTLATAFFVVLVTFAVCAPLLVSAQDAPAQNGGEVDVNPSEGAVGPLSKMGATIGNFILYIGSWFTWFGGILLDGSINNFIIGLGALIGDGSSIGNAIKATWLLVRDVCNLAFIFGFIYIGLRTIIDADSSNTKRMLASIIIGALLINFSLFISKAVIEASNRVSNEIYKTMVDSGAGGSIARKFEHQIGLSTIYATPENVKDFASRSAGGNITFYFMATLFLIIAGFVFAAGAILLMVRFVVLIFILCFSPILFAATVFPATKPQAEKLWHQLINYSLFAPAYLFLLVVSLNILGAIMDRMRSGKTMADALSASSNTVTGASNDAAGVFLSFCIAILFLILSLQVASKFGIAGADRAIAMGNNLRNRGQRMLTAAPRAVARIGVGKGSKTALKSFDKWQAKPSDKQGAVGKLVRKGLVATNLDRDIRGTLEAGKKVKFGFENSYQDNLDYEDTRKKRLAQTAKNEQFKTDIDLVKKKPEELTDDEKVRLERAAANASTKQLEEIEQEQRIALVKFMTQSQIDALSKSDSLTEKEKDEINETRSNIFKEKYGNSADGEAARELRDKLPKANADELNAMGVDFLQDEKHAVRLTNSQMDDLKKKLTPTEYSRIDDARKKALKQLAEDDANIDGKTAQNHILKMKASDMSKLPKEVLFALAPSLPTSTLIEIAKQNTLNAEDQRKIREDIEMVIKEGSTGNYRITDADKKQLEAVDEFLKNNPYGKQFGR